MERNWENQTKRLSLQSILLRPPMDRNWLHKYKYCKVAAERNWNLHCICMHLIYFDGRIEVKIDYSLIWFPKKLLGYRFAASKKEMGSDFCIIYVGIEKYIINRTHLRTVRWCELENVRTVYCCSSYMPTHERLILLLMKKHATTTLCWCWLCNQFDLNLISIMNGTSSFDYFHIQNSFGTKIPPLLRMNEQLIEL